MLALDPQARDQAGRRLVRLIAGNPVTMGQMTRHLPAAGSYAPVTILIQELAGGGTQVAYDTVAARQVDALVWQARDTAIGEATVPVSRSSLTAILRLAELGLIHADQAVMADAQRAVEQIRAVLSGGAEDLAGGADKAVRIVLAKTDE